MQAASYSESMDTTPTREITRLVFDKNWDDLEELCRSEKSEYKNIIFFKPSSLAGDTVLHYAARDERTLNKMLNHLRDDVDRNRALSMPNYCGDTPLHMTASWGNLETTKLLLNQCSQLFYQKNIKGETPMYRAATFGKKKVLAYLFYHFLDEHHHGEDGEFTEKLDYQCNRNDGTSILHVAVRGRHIGTALWIEKNMAEYIDPRNTLDQRKDKRGMTCLQLLADIKSVFESGFYMNTLARFVYWCVPVEQKYTDVPVEDNSTILSCTCGDMDRISLNVLNFLAEGWPVINDIRWKKKRHARAMALTKILVPNDLSWERSLVPVSDNGNGGHRGSERKNEDSDLTPLLLAASNGIIESVQIILDVYPQAIDHVSANQQNILHIAIQHRQREIFRLVKKKRETMESLVPRIDKDGNSILHQVGVVKHCHHKGLTNPALQLQDELRWFERVKKLLPEHYETLRNGEDMTPKQYFDKNHKDQLEEAHNWSKDTSQSCSTVAALIATIVFAAAYTVPGGSEKGVPIFLHSTLFKIFTVMDIISLGSSLTSLVIFLSILTSPFKYDDFIISIPGRMMFGFSFLLISVASTMVAFTVTILLTVRLQKEWTRSLIYVIGFLPVSIFALLHFPLIAGFQITWRETKRLKHILPNFQARSPCFKMDYKSEETTHSSDDKEMDYKRKETISHDDPEDPSAT